MIPNALYVIRQQACNDVMVLAQTTRTRAEHELVGQSKTAL